VKERALKKVREYSRSHQQQEQEQQEQVVLLLGLVAS
jgi:hypothetical protein